MRTIRATKSIAPGLLQQEIAEAIPALAPTPTGPGGRLEAQLVVEAVGRRALIQVPDEFEDDEALEAVLAAHRKRDDSPVDPVAEAVERLKLRAEGDEVIRDLLVVLGV